MQGNTLFSRIFLGRCKSHGRIKRDHFVFGVLIALKNHNAYTVGIDTVNTKTAVTVIALLPKRKHSLSLSAESAAYAVKQSEQVPYNIY